jgi:hypothetical protein
MAFCLAINEARLRLEDFMTTPRKARAARDLDQRPTQEPALAAA